MTSRAHTLLGKKSRKKENSIQWHAEDERPVLFYAITMQSLNIP